MYKAATGPDGILEGLQKGSIWIDHSTTDYNQNLYFEEEASKKGMYNGAKLADAAVARAPPLLCLPRKFIV